MSIGVKSIFLSAALAAMILPAAAQDSSTPATPEPVPPQKQTVFRGRQENEQRRIHQGVKSGELTKGEAKHLERQHRRLNREAAHLRNENGGTLTPAEKARLSRQQNRESRHIYRAKHNDRDRK
jgi:hypothetical protein